MWGVSVKEGPSRNAPGLWQSKLSQAESRLAAENSLHPLPRRDASELRNRAEVW